MTTPERTEAPPRTEAGEELPAPTNPLAVARHLAPEWHRDGLPDRLHWRGMWMVWDGSHWREAEDTAVRAALYRRLEHTGFYVPSGKGEPVWKPWAPNKRKIADLLDAAMSLFLLGQEADAPAWLGPADDEGRRSAVPPSGPIVACANGLLRIQGRELLPHTPAFFNLAAVPFAYDPGGGAPEWHRFLAQLWPDDPDSIHALQEWFGYVLSGRTDQQKILLIVGPTRSGKGTIARVLTALVGAQNYAGPTLASLGTNFGLSPLVGKTLAVVSDARLNRRESPQVVERLLTISGEDTIDVDRKYRPLWTGKLPTRLMILSNLLPSFDDSSGVIANRFIVLNTPVSWLGREDPTLTTRLTAELPGILNWALEGLERLQERGHFTQPPGSVEAITSMQDTASPISAFVREVCETGPDCQVPVEELWLTWQNWAADNGLPAGTKQLFRRDLQAVVPQLRRSKPRGASGAQIPAYTGITLRPEAGQSGIGRGVEPELSRRVSRKETALTCTETEEPEESQLWRQLTHHDPGTTPDEPEDTEAERPHGALLLCPRCQQAMAPALTSAGHLTHPDCSPAARKGDAA